MEVIHTYSIIPDFGPGKRPKLQSAFIAQFKTVTQTKQRPELTRSKTIVRNPRVSNKIFKRHSHLAPHAAKTRSYLHIEKGNKANMTRKKRSCQADTKKISFFFFFVTIAIKAISMHCNRGPMGRSIKKRDIIFTKTVSKVDQRLILAIFTYFFTIIFIFLQTNNRRIKKGKKQPFFLFLKRRRGD
ncbi:hypothetical protein V6Z11_D13G075600 [Gossypium hirsutum]